MLIPREQLQSATVIMATHKKLTAIIKSYLLILLSLLSLSCHADIRESCLSDTEIYDILRSLVYSEKASDDKESFEILGKNWEEGMIAPLVEIMRFSNDRRQLGQINKILQKKTGQSHTEFFEWMQWLWDSEIPAEAYYFDFKAEIYKHIDPLFERYFRDRDGQNEIKLEEVVWGGVYQDGIPPLRLPELILPADATYLSDSDVVFGVYINGVAKAYPKRILAWHEMFVDEFGGDIICGVYCTLCGTVIAYDTEYEGQRYDLGTSGFLYRSNKLMYDKATQSLWNTIEGKPVLGPLHDSGVELDVLPVVTSTWGQWRQLHPDTKVLSLNTGHQRDYGEGVAYNNYFSTDELMFPVPKLDKSLKNKDQVLVIRVDGYKDNPTVIDINYLRKKEWHQDQVAGQDFIAIADASGAARVYDTAGNVFKSYKDGQLTDDKAVAWKVHHDKIVGPEGALLERLPSHNIFWFAWYNSYPETRLIK